MENFKIKLTEKLEKINAIIENSKNGKNTYRKVITEKNKVIIISKGTLKTLNNNGVKLEKTYISYNSTPLLYNTMEKILTENKEVFQLVEK